MKWWQWLLIIVLFISINLVFWIPTIRTKKEPAEISYYIMTWGDEDITQIQKMCKVVQILISDLYQQRIISWEADELLKELDKKYEPKYK